jgi:signal transduction histidine kinase
MEQIQGTRWVEFWDPEYHSTVKESIENAKKGKASQFQAYCRTFKGTGKWWDVVVSSVGTPQTGIKSIIAVSRDITEQKKASEKIRQSEERYRQLAASLEEKVIARTSELTKLYNDNIRQMEELQKALEADQMKSDFIKMASHELKTPITSVKGYVQLLLTMLGEEGRTAIDPAILHNTLGSVEKQVNRIIRLLGELLDLSKIESGQLTLNQEKFCLNELVNDTVQDVLHIHVDHDIRIQSSLDVALFADKDRISQVLVNLLSNAIKYSPNKKHIELQLTQVEDKVRVSVKDQGIGIHENELDKVFNRFYRASGASEQTYPGFGIGLFIAREIIERHGGNIYVKSKKNEGAEFIFELPISDMKKK